MLEKPVLFDVTEPKYPNFVIFWNDKLEKPVLFDVTELIYIDSSQSLARVGKAGFI